jgi:hypothetical protein
LGILRKPALSGADIVLIEARSEKAAQIGSNADIEAW